MLQIVNYKYFSLLSLLIIRSMFSYNVINIKSIENYCLTGAAQRK